MVRADFLRQAAEHAAERRDRRVGDQPVDADTGMKQQALGKPVAEIAVRQPGRGHAGDDQAPFEPRRDENRDQHEDRGPLVEFAWKQDAILDDGVVLDVDIDERNGGNRCQHNEQTAAPRLFRRCPQRQDEEHQHGAHVDVDVFEQRRRPQIVFGLEGVDHGQRNGNRGRNNGKQCTSGLIGTDEIPEPIAQGGVRRTHCHDRYRLSGTDAEDAARAIRRLTSSPSRRMIAA